MTHEGAAQAAAPDDAASAADGSLMTGFPRPRGRGSPDALVVLHDGQLVAERYDAGMTAGTPHLLMSVSKSVVGCVAGVLAAALTGRAAG